MSPDWNVSMAAAGGLKWGAGVGREWTHPAAPAPRSVGPRSVGPRLAAVPLLSCILPLLLILRPAAAEPAAAAQDLTALPFEQLLAMEVYSASKFVQQASQAPSTVSVISAGDIRTFGWRTLADVLRSVRGLYLSYDRNYSYLGARSFLRPGDYNTRFLLQIDGNRINDAVYDQAPVGGEFPLDLDLVERIEYAPGPGSSIYGANAFFGVINVITKRARDIGKSGDGADQGAGGIGGARASVELGQFGARKGSASYGWSDRRGNDVLLSASRYKSDGRDLYFAEFDHPAENHGIARGLDYETGQRFFAKGASGPFSVSLLHAARAKGVPTASFEQAFNDARSRTLDTQTYLDLGYRIELASGADLSARLYWGRYDSAGDYAGDLPQSTLNHDGSASRWWGVDLKAVSVARAGHKLVAGVEYQRDYRLAQFSYDVEPYLEYLNERRHSARAGLYLQDEIALRDDLLLNAGLRYDHHARSGGLLNPRLALIWQAAPDTTLKALYGTSYREPNNFELYYAFAGPGGQNANPGQGRERIRSTELALVRQLPQNGRITVTAFQNQVRGLISQTSDPDTMLTMFRNASSATARGVELEYERHWSNAMLRTSYSRQALAQDGADVSAVNSPSQLAKLNLALPLGSTAWRAGIEAQYVGPRDTLLARTGGYWLANLNLFSTRLTRHADVAVGIYNMFDRRYADPAPAAHRQDSIAQDGRSVRMTLSYGL